MKAADRRQALRLHVRKGLLRARKGAAVAAFRFKSVFRSSPEKLIVAPTDLRAADPFIAEEIMHGRFTLAGRTMETGGASPFGLDMPSPDFEAKLHAFGWLRDFRATRNEQYFLKAQSITNDWIAVYKRPGNTSAWIPAIAAQRLVAWLSHSTIVLRNAEIGFYRRFLRSLGTHVAYLNAVVTTIPDNQERFRIRVALALASLALPSTDRQIRTAGLCLEKELDRQILPDGGHISRNPKIILELLLDLLPLRQTYINLGHEVPSRLIPAIDRMFPALRFFRHQGGELALFNAATATLATDLAAVLRYDETSGPPFKALPYLQYHRLAENHTVVIVDTGKAPNTASSAHVHAGCLSFEMSSGKFRFIVNAGSPRFGPEDYRQLARSTAAHSTVTINDRSTLNFSKFSSLGSLVTGGVSLVDVVRKDRGQGEGLTARHNGYLAAFGVLHERDLQLNSGGTLIRGRDRLLQPDGSDPLPDSKLHAVARFHIHPAVNVRRIDNHEVLLTAPDGQAWSFSCIDTAVEIGEDVFFADPSGARPSWQLELAFDGANTPEVQWVMEQKGAVSGI